MKFDDIGWLGERFERYAPGARAAVGILLKRRGWDWYYLRSPSELEHALSNAIFGYGIAAWGGDEAVLSVSEWLDPSRAVTLSRAFQRAASERFGFRIRIARDIWDWQSPDDVAFAVRADLAKAAPDAAIFYEWPKDRRPPRADVRRADGKVLVSSPPGSSPRSIGSALAEAIGEAAFEPDTRKADIFVASSISELLAANTAADLLIVVEDDSRRVVERLDDLRVQKAARCIVRVPQTKAREWMQAFGSFWSQSAAIDTAVSDANAAENLRAEVVAANQTFVLQSAGFLSRASRETRLPSVRRVGFGLPSAPADDLPARLEPVEEVQPAPPPSKRVLDATVFQGKRRVRDLPLSGQLRIEVLIKPKSPSSVGQPDFPDDLIDWKGDSRTLQVHMIELDSQPVTRKLHLPRKGPSSVVEFDYEVVPQKMLDLRFMVCDRAQILQTARLKAKPGHAIKLSFEAGFTSLERERPSFDLALMVNDSLGGRPSATVLSPEGVQINAFDTGEIAPLRDQALQALETVVTNPTLPLQHTLMELANIGSEMLDVIRAKITIWPTDLERIQLATKENAFFPLEFLYDGVVPKHPDAPVCPQSKSCLRSASSSSCCTIREEAEVLCPMGFIGLKTVIERQVWSEEVEGPIWLKESVELSSRHKVGGITKIAFAASDTADDFEDTALPSGTTLARIQSIVDELAPRLDNWDDWATAVANEEFSMAILIAHIENTVLYIGKSEKLNRARLDFGTVPVAVMLGCKSAIGVVASMSIPARIMRNGHTRVVVAALTDLLGRHANTAALHLGKRIRDASLSATPVTLGEFIVELRRDLLADDIAAGLILVALGDADIALGA
jgi:hypothetical protein